MSTAAFTAHSTTLRKSRAWYLILLGFPLLVATGLLILREMQVRRLATGEFPSYGSVPPFELTNQDGRPFGSADLAGKIWMADFIYSTCPGPCPMISSRMSEMQKPLEKTDVHFVSFTVDPETDTPAVLREYASRLHAQTGRWDFLTGSKAAIYDLIERGFKLAVAEHDGDNGQPIHSTRMVLVDRRGQIRAYEDGTASDAVTKLLAEANHLLREQPAWTK
jgi:cytochrome oxidase Cu insertion factor (SCO1/SenC/PrrC family)